MPNWKTAAIACGSTIYSGAVLAVADPHLNGPSWQTIAIGAVGLFIASVGWYAKGIASRVDRLETRVAELNTIMLKEYHPKSDVREMLDEVRESMKLFQIEMKSSMADLKSRFDKFESLYGR